MPNWIIRILSRPPCHTTPPSAVPSTQQTWFWTLLLGISMLLGGILAMMIAVTVVLPYDEAFVGLSREQLAALNPRLLGFLAHDRVSLAGTMIAVGVLYIQLSLYAVRRGRLWARLTILTSAFAGFFSFFLFLGFGYLEPFHAFVTAILFQFLLFALYSKPGETEPPYSHEEGRWRPNQWGRLLFVLHGILLIGAGMTISLIGVTHVFVHEDLDFMLTTADELTKASPRLLPMIAHDRATFGGMLISTGIVVLLSALWGFAPGNAWLWRGFLVAGSVAYTAAIGVHIAVGYVNWWHLLPATGGATMLAVGLALSYRHLCGPAVAGRLQVHDC